MGIALENVVNGTNMEHFVCSICTNLLDDAVVLKSCEHMYCRECINQWAKSEKPTTGASSCPECRQTFTQADLVKPMRVVQALLSQVELNCSNNGCLELILYDNFRKHVKTCPKANIQCPSCNASVQKSQFEPHKKICVPFLSAEVKRLNEKVTSMQETQTKMLNMEKCYKEKIANMETIHRTKISNIEKNHIKQISSIKESQKTKISKMQNCHKSEIQKLKNTISTTKMDRTKEKKESKPSASVKADLKPVLCLKSSGLENETTLTTTALFDGMLKKRYTDYSSYMKVEGGLVRVGMELLTYGQNNSEKPHEYFVSLDLQQDTRALTEKIIQAEWKVTVSWKKKPGTKELKSTSMVTSHVFDSRSESASVAIVPVPGRKSEISATIEILSWSVIL